MKSKNSIISFLFILFFVGSLNGFAGGNDIFVGDYKISPKVDFTPTKEYQQNWEITYGESKRPVQVLLRETKKGDEYLVRTNYFEVKYVSSEKGFGACPVKVSDLIVPENLNSQVINEDQLNTQKVITASPVSREKALGLIADFLPELVNDRYKNILN
jgi:hypothetical protein